MKTLVLSIIIGSITCLAQAQTGLDLKGKMKEGQYETTFKMEIPGLPAGVSGFNTTVKNCVTKEGIEKGKGDMFRDPKAGSKETSCVVKNVKNSGNIASYDVDCPVEGMFSTTTIAFGDDHVRGLTKTKMTGENAKSLPPGMANMQMQFESKYLGGACSK